MADKLKSTKKEPIKIHQEDSKLVKALKLSKDELIAAAIRDVLNRDNIGKRGLS